MSSSVSNLQLLNNTEYRLKFKTGSDINNALIQPTTTHSLSFNGTDQHGIISDLEINGAFTISMWVKLKDYQSGLSVYPLFVKDYISTGTTDIFLDLGNGRLRANVYDRTGPWATQISCQMTESLSNDTWHHIMMTYDGTVNDSAIRTFINGVESINGVIRSIDNSSSFYSVNSPADTDAYIGWGSISNRKFKGEMDQIAIWHSDQSSNISSIYTGDSPADLKSSPDHLFELNNSTDNSTGTSTLTLDGGGEFKRKYIYATPRYSAQVDGDNDQIGIGYDSSGNLRGSGNMLGITGDSHTFCFWIKPLDPANSNGRFVYNSKIQIELRTDGFRFYTPGINKHHIHTVTPDTWYFLALSCDGKSHTSYVKSVSDDISATVEGQSFTTINSGYVTFGPNVKARYDEIAAFNSALSASEIDRIYKYGIRGNSNLAGYWRMGDASGGTGIIIPDELGGEDAQLRNGAFFSNDTAPLPDPTLKDPLVGELLLDKTGDTSGVDLDGETRIDTDYTYNGSGEITVSAWVKTTKAGKFMIATDSQVGGAESRFAFGMDGSNFYVLLGNSSNQQVVHKTSAASNLVNDGQWHHLVYRVDSSNEATVWLDGSIDATHQTNFAIDNSIHVTSYGSGWSDGTAPVYDTWGFNGQLKGLGIWETALTDQQINEISMSGMNSSVPYSLSPNVWVGPTGPALYACTDTSGTISKVSGNLAKMGNVPMLKANANVFTRTNSISSSGAGLSYSFWFYDDGTETGQQTIFKNDTTHNSYVTVNHDASIITFNKHAHSSNIIINNSSIASAIMHGFQLTYEKNKLNNFLFTKQTADPYFTKLYLNGELVASSDENVSYWPGDLFKEINPKITNGEEMEFSLLLGDFAYWDADISNIVDEVYSPVQGHIGYQGNWMNISIPPKHYWKLGAPMESGQVKDIGTDGTNHFISRQPLEETYTIGAYQNESYIFQPQDGVMHGMTNGSANPYDPEMFMLAGDTINFTRSDSLHPLHIKDSSGNDVASSVDQGDGTYKTTFSPTIAGTYQYYCTSHSSMIGNINVLKKENYENIFGID